MTDLQAGEYEREAPCSCVCHMWQKESPLNSLCLYCSETNCGQRDQEHARLLDELLQAAKRYIQPCPVCDLGESGQMCICTEREKREAALRAVIEKAEKANGKP